MLDSNIIISEAIKWGSIYETIVKKVVSTEDILKYLIKNINQEVSKKYVTAYRCVCIFDKDQIITCNEQRKHFLSFTLHPEYVAIYCMSYPGSPLPGTTIEENINLGNIFQIVWSKLLTQHDFSRTINLLCDFNDIDVLDTDLDLIISARSMKYIRAYKMKYTEKSSLTTSKWLSHDFLEPIKNTHYATIDGYLVTRCQILKQRAPLYWDKVAMPLYKKYILKALNIDKPVFCFARFQIYKNLFPDLFPTRLLNMSSLEYNIRLHTKTIQAYILGFPIDKYTPSDEIIEKAIISLLDKGIVEYSELVENNNKLVLTDYSLYQNPFENDGFELKQVNKNNVILDSIFSYNRFDVIRYWSGKDSHVYCFTRSEFPSLLAKKQNHWTGSKIPYDILREITFKMHIAEEKELPKSDTIENILTRVDKGENIWLDETVNRIYEDQGDEILNIDNAELVNGIISQENDIWRLWVGGESIVLERNAADGFYFEEDELLEAEYQIRLADIFPPPLNPSPDSPYDYVYEIDSTISEDSTVEEDVIEPVD